MSKQRRVRATAESRQVRAMSIGMADIATEIAAPTKKENANEHPGWNARNRMRMEARRSGEKSCLPLVGE